MSDFSDKLKALFWGFVLGSIVAFFIHTPDLGPLSATAIYAWAIGMFSSVPAFVMVFLVGPWLMGWRKVTYNVHWTDANKRYQIWKAVEWVEHQPGRPHDNPSLMSRLRNSFTRRRLPEHREVAEQHAGRDFSEPSVQTRFTSSGYGGSSETQGQGLDRYDEHSPSAGWRA